MKFLTLVLICLFWTFSGSAVQKVFSPKKTFPFEGGSYWIRGVAKNVIYLTIDDGPTREGTPAVLNVLRDHGVPATFFVQGAFARNRPELLERMYREGHLIGNHSYEHVVDFPTGDSFQSSLLRTHQYISPFIPNESVLLYRAPGGIWNDWRAFYGNQNPTLRRYVGPLFWNVGGGSPGREDDADWKCWRRGNGVTVNACADSYYNQIIANYRKGQSSLVLLHDLKSLSARMLDRLLTRLKRSGVSWEFRLADDMPIIQEYSRL